MNWWVIFSCDPSRTAGVVPWRIRPERYGWGHRPGKTGLHSMGLTVSLSQLSEVVRPEWQMEGYVDSSHIPMAQSAAPKKSTSRALNHPKSFGISCGRSHNWNQNLLFQMEPTIFPSAFRNTDSCLPHEAATDPSSECGRPLISIASDAPYLLYYKVSEHC